LSPLEAPAEVARLIAQFIAAIEDKSINCNSPEQVPVAFDAALNAGDLDAVLGMFSNRATMRKTNGDVVKENPTGLRIAFAQLLALRPRIHN
jgi:hypothetical protein